MPTPRRPHADKGDSLDPDDADWSSRLIELSGAVTRWTGNEASVIEYSESEIAELVEADESIVASIQSEGIHLVGRRRLLKPSPSAPSSSGSSTT